MAQLEIDKLERELLDYFYLNLSTDVPAEKQKKQIMKEYHSRRVKCYVCLCEMRRAQLYYHLKKVHNTTAKKYLKNK